MASENSDFRTVVRQAMKDLLSSASGSFHQHDYEHDHDTLCEDIQIQKNWDVTFLGHYIGQWLDRLNTRLQELIDNEGIRGLSIDVSQEAYDGYIRVEVAWRFRDFNPIWEVLENEFIDDVYEAEWEATALETAKAEMD